MNRFCLTCDQLAGQEVLLGLVSTPLIDDNLKFIPQVKWVQIDHAMNEFKENRYGEVGCDIQFYGQRMVGIFLGEQIRGAYVLAEEYVTDNEKAFRPKTLTARTFLVESDRVRLSAAIKYRDLPGPREEKSVAHSSLRLAAGSHFFSRRTAVR